MFMDRYGGWICQERIPPLAEEQLTTRRRAAPLTIKAGLAGITKDERQKVLDYFFSSTSAFDYGSGEDAARRVKTNEDESAQEVDVENPSGKPCCLSHGGPSTADAAHHEQEGSVEREEINENNTKRMKERSVAMSSGSISAIPKGAAKNSNGTDPKEKESYDCHGVAKNRNDAEDVELQKMCMMEHKEGTCPICLMEYGTLGGVFKVG